MSKKSKVEEMDEATQDAQTVENPELNEEHIDAENATGENEEISVEDQLREDLAKEKDKFLRLFAEFENFKRRTSKERMELFKTAGQGYTIFSTNQVFSQGDGRVHQRSDTRAP